MVDITPSSAPTPRTLYSKTPTEESGSLLGDARADVIRSRLESAGYEVEDRELPSGEPIPDAALDVPIMGGGELTVYVHADPADAEEVASGLEVVARENPGQARVRTEDANVYVGTIQEPATLPESRFNTIVDIAEGL